MLARVHNLFLTIDKASMVTQMQASLLTVWQQKQQHYLNPVSDQLTCHNLVAIT